MLRAKRDLRVSEVRRKKRELRLITNLNFSFVVFYFLTTIMAIKYSLPIPTPKVIESIRLEKTSKNTESIPTMPTSHVPLCDIYPFLEHLHSYYGL